MNITSLTAKIVDYESGRLSDNEIIELYAELIQTGMAFRLQGSYGRMAIQLIKQGFIDDKGNILRYPEEVEE